MMPDRRCGSTHERQRVNPDLTLLSDPVFVLLAWSGGVALATSVVTARAIVGSGFTWLGAATAALIGVWPALAGRGALGWVAVVGAVAGGSLAAWNKLAATGVLLVAAASSVVAAGELGGPLLAATGVVALGGITGEMLLGHWYLVDPTLPRQALRVLAYTGVVGVMADGAVLGLLGFPGGGPTVVIYWVLVMTTVLLMVAVVGALRHPAYSGVMAATGLSYLAVLTGLAAVFFGRVLAAGSGPVLF